MTNRQPRVLVSALGAAFVGCLLLALGACELATHVGDFATVAEAGSVVYIYADSAFTCPAGQTECTEDGGIECHDLTDDLQNCGACGKTCAARRACSNGACACVAGTTLCGDVCTVLDADPANCGKCGVTCPTDSICAAGTCVADCQEGQTTCSNKCVDLQTSNSSCGLCGSACAGLCVSGSCCTTGVCKCPAGQPMCAGACTDTNTSAANCGGCGNPCGPSQSCIAGKCTCAAGLTLCGTCQSCPTGSICTTSTSGGETMGVCSCALGEANGACCVAPAKESAGACCASNDTGTAQANGTVECCRNLSVSGSPLKCCPSGQTYCLKQMACISVGTACDG